MHVTLTWSTKIWNKDEITAEAQLMASLDPAIGDPIVAVEEGKQNVLLTFPYYRSKATAETIAAISAFSAKHGPAIMDQRSSLKGASQATELINETTGAPITHERTRPPKKEKLTSRLLAIFKRE